MRKCKRGAIVKITTVAVIFIIIHLLSVAYPRLLFPSVPEIAESLMRIFRTVGFYVDVATTFVRVLLSFVSVMISATALAVLSCRSELLSDVLSVLVSIIKSTPFASLALILFFFMKSGTIPIFIAFLFAFPIMYVSISDSFASRDADLESLCDVYGISGFRRLIFFYLPSLIPSVVTSSKVAFSMIIKVVASSEILIYVKSGIGRNIEDASLKFDSAALFAWTIVAILMCMISDVFFGMLTKAVADAGFIRENSD
ncbi:MAG TPA: hypothetical protein DCO86_02020 [Spirochaetaceae bacterium]|nr:hypothetical protein [Spirochaetaceae bacterium]